MSDSIAAHDSPGLGTAYYQAAKGGRRKRDALVAELDLPTDEVWYADNSREGIRDDCLRNALLPNGAVVRDNTKPITSAVGIWTLAAPFAALFGSQLDGDELEETIAAWQQRHLTNVGRARIEAARRHQDTSTVVAVDLPDLTRHLLPPGIASLLTRDVIELMAPRLLTQPAVLFVASSDVPVPARFSDLELDPTVLADVVLFDLDQEDIWFVEVVATDGVIDDSRRDALINWAQTNGYSAEQCKFVTAFASRTSRALRKRLAELAWDSMVWFADEPDRLVYLSELSD